MLICLGVSDGTAEVLDTDDFTTEKMGVSILLKSGLKIMNLTSDGKAKKFECVITGKLFMLYRVMKEKSGYNIEVNLYSVNNGIIRNVLSLSEMTLGYPSVNLWVSQIDYNDIELSISYFAKHFYKEDSGKALNRVISLDSNGGILSDKKDVGFDKGYYN